MMASSTAGSSCGSNSYEQESSVSVVSDDQESTDDNFFLLSEDHFSEMAHDELMEADPELPIDKKSIERAIHRYMRLIRIDGYDDEKKRKLIIKLCDMRIKLNQMNEDMEVKYFNGHRLSKTSDHITCLTCDVCLKKQRIIIFHSLQSNQILTCDYCGYNIHRNCMMQNVTKVRKCPRLLLEDEEELNAELKQDAKYSKYIIFSICPESGLSKQSFRCSECSDVIHLNSAKLCDFDGQYYCNKCHWGDLESTPARILHNWDMTPQAVSRRSFQTITYLKRKPVLFDVMQFNSMLYGLVEDLPIVKRIRVELSQMNQYLKHCHQPNKPPINTINQYLLDPAKINYFSLNDLIGLESLKKHLIEHHTLLFNHITIECEGCRGKGFYCGLCSDRRELLFPFSANISICPECSTVYHRTCYQRKYKRCIKCLRLREKESRKRTEEELKEVLDGSNDLENSDGKHQQDLQNMTGEINH